MLRLICSAVLAAGGLSSVAALADDDPPDNLPPSRGVASSSYVESLPPGPLATYSPLPFQPLAENPAVWSWRQDPVASIDFHDNSALGRLGRLRSLSLLTLAEGRGTRLFLGVNADGVVGLHFSATDGFSRDNYLELVRMPYLKEGDTDE